MGKRSRKHKAESPETYKEITKNQGNQSLKEIGKEFIDNPFGDKKKNSHMRQILAAGCAMLAICFILVYSGGNGDDADVVTDVPETEITADVTQTETESETKTEISIGAMTGPTGMGLAKLMSDDAAGETLNDYEFEIAGAVTEISPLFIKGDLDMIAVPANMGSVLYGQTDSTQVLAINTLGVLYIVENGDTINESADLAGKTIYMAGKGSTPEYTINHILEYVGLTGDVTIEFKSEHAEVLAAMLAEPGSVGMLPEPYVTTALMQSEDLRVAIDLNDSWEYIHDGNGLITGTMLVNADFAAENPEAVADFLVEYAASTAYANENVEDAAALMEEFGIINANIAEIAIPNANLVTITGDEMEELLSDYLEILYEQDATSVGGALPDENFYYTK